MANVTVTLTEDQALYVQQLLSAESEKVIAELMLANVVMGPLQPNATDEQKAARKAVTKPIDDREQALYEIEQAFSAGWPKASAS